MHIYIQINELDAILSKNLLVIPFITVLVPGRPSFARNTRKDAFYLVRSRYIAKHVQLHTGRLIVLERLIMVVYETVA